MIGTNPNQLVIVIDLDTPELQQQSDALCAWLEQIVTTNKTQALSAFFQAGQILNSLVLHEMRRQFAAGYTPPAAEEPPCPNPN